jgi:hypothetical protein
MAADPEARRRMGPLARHLYEEEFAFERSSARLLDILSTFDERQLIA